ncbi:MAG: hypothetical protein NUW22_05115 [Acidobacteria bacterium]|nr:hypothetical protein [Acidobacteriota bacterium]
MRASRDRLRYQRQPPPPVDIAAVVAHLTHLKAAYGIGAWQIAHLTGVSERLVHMIRQKQHVRILPSTAAKLLAAQPVRAPGQRVVGLPAWRIVRWLESEGYTRPQVARLVGVRSIGLRKHYTARVVAKLHAIKRHLERGSRPDDEGSFGDASPPPGQS